MSTVLAPPTLRGTTVARATTERDSEHATRLSCPDCSGVLSVRPVEDHGASIFVCRVGHTYSISDLLAGKEEQVEARLWSVVVVLEELVDVLEEFRRHAERQGLQIAAHALHERAERLVGSPGTCATSSRTTARSKIGEEVCRIRATAEVL